MVEEKAAEVVPEKETPDCLKPIMGVKVVWIDENTASTFYTEVISIDLGYATKEVVGKIVDYNIGWITLQHKWFDKKTYIKTSQVKTFESWEEKT